MRSPKAAVAVSAVLLVAVAQVGSTLAQSAGPPVTITYWENILDDGGVQDSIIGRYQADHPNVTVQRVPIQYGDMQVKLPTAMGAGTGPDLVYFDVDPASLGTYTKAGKVLSLEQAYKDYGWESRVFPWAQRRVTYYGDRQAVGHELETLGLIYNKKIFDQLGLAVPQTLEELESTMAAIKTDGRYTPMMLAAGPGGPWNAFHMMNAIAYATIPMDLIYAATPQGTGSYGPEWVAAFQQFDDWVKAGYFPAQAGSIDWDNHWAMFCAGQVAMLTQGTWLLQSLSDCEKENPDLLDYQMAPWPVPAGDPFQAYVGLGSGWYASSTAGSDAAREKATLDLIDALISDQAAVEWVRDAQLFPAVPFDQSAVTLTPQQEQALAIVQKAGPDGGGPMPIGFQNSPEEADVWAQVLQGIVAGTETPQGAVDRINVELKKAQEAWNS